VFDIADNLLETQKDDGTWELPRSKLRPSIWAIWPFIAALCEVRRTLVPDSDAKASLLYNGVLLRHSSSRQQLTRGLLIRNSLVEVVLEHKLRSILVALVLAIGLTFAGLFLAGGLDFVGLILGLVVPTLFLAAEVGIERLQTDHKGHRS
jgi:hypothetical protein